jgi:hypothetical protein
MARPADLRKSAVSQRRMQRFTASGTTVSKFCDRAGVSVAAFHYWRRTLGREQSERVAFLAAPVFQPPSGGRH